MKILVMVLMVVYFLFVYKMQMCQCALVIHALIHLEYSQSQYDQIWIDHSLFIIIYKIKKILLTEFESIEDTKLTHAMYDPATML